MDLVRERASLYCCRWSLQAGACTLRPVSCRVFPADGHGLTQLHIYGMSYNFEIPLSFIIILPDRGTKLSQMMCAMSSSAAF